MALLTAAMEAAAPGELEALVDEFLEKDDRALVLALVALSRSLCMATSKLVHVLDDQLSDDEARELRDDELRPMALAVLRSYALAAAKQSGMPQDD